MINESIVKLVCKPSLEQCKVHDLTS